MLGFVQGAGCPVLREPSLLLSKSPRCRQWTPGGRLVGRSPELLEIFKTIGRVAGSDVTVLITGESGTGKELVARAIHAASPRAEAPFAAVNTAAIPRDLLESELFGHERGAFTGAVATRTGLFRDASGGTIFLDEIGDMPVELQAKLLRVLQSGELTPIGGRTVTHVDVRILAATHRDLDASVREGRFREDLLYRLRVIPIQIPPLRERREDISLLAEHFTAHYAEELSSGQSRKAHDSVNPRPWVQLPQVNPGTQVIVHRAFTTCFTVPYVPLPLKTAESAGNL